MPALAASRAAQGQFKQWRIGMGHPDKLRQIKDRAVRAMAAEHGYRDVRGKACSRGRLGLVHLALQ
jgi:hypothetical protein